MRCIRVMVVVVALCGAARAQGVLDKPSFTAAPAELIAAAKAAPAGNEYVVLREDQDFIVDDKGLIRSRWRMVIAVLTQAGADEWQQVATSWNPTFQDKPALRARVIDPGGKSTDVDPARLHEDPPEGDQVVRSLQLPLPRLAVGSVLEQEVTLVDRVTLPGGGLRFAALGNGGPTLATRVTVTAPAKSNVHVTARGVDKVKPKLATANGKQTWRYDVGKLPPTAVHDAMVPPDVVTYVGVGLSTATSWAAVATGYAAMVDKAIAAGSVPMPAKLPTTPTLDSVRAITHWVNGMLAYRYEDFYSSAMAPATPAEILRRGRADSNDKATLLVALLRLAGVRADLALISQRAGTDIDRELPALNVFDHVLVRVVLGKTVTWIDPSDAFAAVGQLSEYSQGRRALVIAKDTTDLIVTPASTSADNVIRERRTYLLAEAGNARIVEVAHEGGMFEASQRDWMHTTSATDVRTQFLSYIKSEYVSTELVDYKSTPPNDLSLPYEVTITAGASERAVAGRDQIDVYLFAPDALDSLPWVLRQAKADMPKRTHDFQLTRPHRHIIETRLVIPPGFKVPVPAATKTRPLGPMRLVETQRVDGRDLVVTYELDTVKVRFTPAEVTAAQTAIRALDQDGTLHLAIENIGASLLLAGKAREAIAELDRMAKLHPKEALHHAELARAYLAVGAGAAARRAARKAVALEPTDDDAHTVLGWVLGHDELGRRFTGNFDRAGARKALERARQLNPKHVGAAKELGFLLERSATGYRFDPGTDFAGAAAAYKAAYELDGDAETGFSYMRVLLFEGRHEPAITFGRTLPQSETRDTLIVAGVGASKGGAAALQTATELASNVTARSKLVTSAAGVLFLMRSYDPMRVLFGELKALPTGSTQSRMFAGIKKRATPFKAGKSPADAVLDIMVASLVAGRTTNAFWDKEVEQDFHNSVVEGLSGFGKSRDTMTSGLLEDLALALVVPKVDGDAKAWRVEIDVGTATARVYLAADRGVAKAFGGDKAMAGVGRYLLRLLAQNDEATATRILDWLDKDAPQMKGDFAAFAVPALWGAKLPRTRQAMELVAAVLAGTTMLERTMPILERCGATTPEGQFLCDIVFSQGLRAQKRWSDLEDHAKAWSGRGTQSSLQGTLRAYAIARQGRYDEADKVIDDLLTAHPDDRTLLMTRVEISMMRGQMQEAVKRMRAVTTAVSAVPMDHNNLAWLLLIDGTDLDGALDVAKKALQETNQSSSAMHTLGSIEAERGELVSAWEHGVGAMTAAQEGPESSSVQYLHGRVLEQLGLKDDAIAAYRKAAASKTKSDGTFPSSAELSVRRLKVLGVRP